MASTNVRLAVQQYRKILLRAHDLEHEEEVLAYTVDKLSNDELHDYAQLTIELDVADSLAQDEEQRNPRWMWTTRRKAYKDRINKSGDDTDRVDLRTS